MRAEIPANSVTVRGVTVTGESDLFTSFKFITSIISANIMIIDCKSEPRSDAITNDY